MTRIAAVHEAKRSLCNTIQALEPWDISDRLVDHVRLVPRDSVRRRLLRLLSRPALEVQQRSIRRRIGFELPFPCDLVSIGERFSRDASIVALLHLARNGALSKVLIPGCYLGGEDVQFWLRRGVPSLEGIDVYSLKKKWAEVIPRLEQQYGAEVHFQQASIENIPFPDATFDLVATSAVLEHVRNLKAMISETARVLRPGGWAWHEFGPLYYTFGGDHCMTAYGDQAGYDHLLLDEEAYQKQIDDQSFFDRQSDPNLPFWARHQQFSYAAAAEYMSLFSEHFKIRFVTAVISEKGLWFRTAHPARWSELQRAGVSEAELLIKGMKVVLEKR